MDDDRPQRQTPAPVEHPEVPADRPRPVHTGPRDPGDAWAYGPDGRKAWGAFGAAGLLVDDGAGRVLLQHRVEWSHYGGTWGIPGGARHHDEDAVTGALRESFEEAGVPGAALRLRHTAVLDLGFWTYTTVVARAVVPFTPSIGDRESLSLDWVAADAVEDLPLHPGFAASWPTLRAALGTTPSVVVDAANVVGSVPDGWWKDRAGAATRLLGRVSALAAAGLPAEGLDLPFATWWPQWTVVLEGDARAATDPLAPETVPSAAGTVEGPAGDGGAARPVGVDVVRAEGSGDDAVVAAATSAVADAGSGSPVVVVTADRGLRERVEAVGAVVRGPSWLLERC